MKDMATFTALVKIFFIKYFSTIQGEIFNFHVYGTAIARIYYIILEFYCHFPVI